MSIEIITGNIFTSTCQTIVNTINCVGVMGAGIALECRLRYPKMYTEYIQRCKENKINIGQLWLYKNPDRWILNFPTKMDWRNPSKIEYLESGLKEFSKTHQTLGINSIAFPLLGADKGGIPKEKSLSIIKKHLEPLNITIQIYKYSPTAKDELYEKTKAWLLAKDTDQICELTDLRKHQVFRMVSAIKSEEIYQLNQLAKIDGIGIKTLEKIFNLAINSLNNNQHLPRQQSLI